MSDLVHYEHRGPAAVITLNRPKVHNAFNPEVIEGLSDIFETLRTAEGVRVVLIEGPAGIGKTRLLREVRTRASGARVLAARGSQLERCRET